MKGTRLWQDTGSPLIAGRSRREQPFWRDWLWGSAIGMVIGVGAVAIVTGGRDGIDALLRVGWVPAVPAALLGAAAGVWIASKFGWRRRWFLGAALATPLVLLGTWVLGLPLMSSLYGQ